MTKFTDQLFDDLMREHGQALAGIRVPAAPKRHLTARPVLLTAGTGGLAVAAAVGTLVAGGGTPAYAVTTHSDGTVTLAVYQPAGIAQANAKLRTLGDRVVVVPVRSGCPSIGSLPAPGVAARQISVQASGSSDGSVTVSAQGVPAGDVLVLGFVQTTGGQFAMQATSATANGHTTGTAHGTGRPPLAAAGSSVLTSGPVPSCVSIPAGRLPSVPGQAGVPATCGHVVSGPPPAGVASGGMQTSAPVAPPASRPVGAQQGGGIARSGKQVSGSGGGCSISSSGKASAGSSGKTSAGNG